MRESPEGFGLISGFVTSPLFFLSGALYPINNLPGWLSAFLMVNPVTYGIDAIARLMLGTYKFSLVIDFSVPALFALTVIVLGTLSFRRMKL